MARTARTFTASLVAAGLVGATLLAAAPAMAGDGVPAKTYTQVGEYRTTTKGVPQTITFTKDGKVFGDSGCNRFTGGYTTKGNHITIGPLASTLMACPDPQMSAEFTFMSKLQSAKTFKATATNLKLIGSKGTLTLKRQ
ncbi:MAG: META domain-containing protein [Actinomycetes bacterium]